MFWLFVFLATCQNFKILFIFGFFWISWFLFFSIARKYSFFWIFWVWGRRNGMFPNVVILIFFKIFLDLSFFLYFLDFRLRIWIVPNFVVLCFWVFLYFSKFSKFRDCLSFWILWISVIVWCFNFSCIFRILVSSEIWDFPDVWIFPKF